MTAGIMRYKYGAESSFAASAYLTTSMTGPVVGWKRRILGQPAELLKQRGSPSTPKPNDFCQDPHECQKPYTVPKPKTINTNMPVHFLTPLASNPSERKLLRSTGSSSRCRVGLILSLSSKPTARSRNVKEKARNLRELSPGFKPLLKLGDGEAA